MKIWKRLHKDHVVLDAPLENKDAVFRFIARAMARAHAIIKPEELYHAILEREQTMSTGIGDGFGLPHAVNQEIKETAVFLIRLQKPIRYKSIDAKPVDIIISMIIPENSTHQYLLLLSTVSRLCRNPEFGTAVRQAEDSKQLWDKIRDIEEKMAFH
jgi:mannitol/fructose-specific phosphotransferase system IIA component (Ntr-type)